MSGCERGGPAYCDSSGCDWPRCLERIIQARAAGPTYPLIDPEESAAIKLLHERGYEIYRQGWRLCPSACQGVAT